MASDQAWLLDGLLGEIGTPLAIREFTAWIPWAMRSELRTRRCGDRIDAYGGVYLLSHEPALTDAPADPLDTHIIYVGEGGWLQRRWRDFERSAHERKDGHSGGHSYYATFGAERWSSLKVVVAHDFKVQNTGGDPGIADDVDQRNKRAEEQQRFRREIARLSARIAELERAHATLSSLLGEKNQQVRAMAEEILRLRAELAEWNRRAAA